MTDLTLLDRKAQTADNVPIKFNYAFATSGSRDYVVHVVSKKDGTLINPAENETLVSILNKLSADPATQTTLASILSALSSSLTVSGSVTVSNFPGTQPISGSVSVSNFPSSQAVTVSNFPASQSVSVSNFPASQSVSVSNFPASQAVTGPITDAQAGARLGASTDAAWDGSSAGTVISILKSMYGKQVNPAALAAGTSVIGKVGIQVAGADVAGANPVPVQTTASEAYIGKVGGNTIIATATMTRPADTTAYTSGDLVANSTVAGSVTPMSLTVARLNAGTFRIQRVRLKKSSTSVSSASFRVHLYRSSPTLTNGDNAAWLSTESNYIGSFDVTMDRTFSDGAKGFGVPTVGSFLAAQCNTGTTAIFALIEARGAYTPTSGEVFELTIESDSD